MNTQNCEVYGSGSNPFRLATGSPGEVGLLKVLAEDFAQKADACLHWTKAGAGQALQLLFERRVDAAMVHAPTQVDQAVHEGWGAEKTLLGANEFFLLGPKADPAFVSGAGGIVEAFRRIARNESPFISRSDNSGTHQKEREVWLLAGIDPQGAWHIPAKDFMTACLYRADSANAYYLCDSTTWIMEKRNMRSLENLFRGDPLLVNVYHALVSPNGATPGRETARRFVNFVASPAGQRIISEFGKNEHGEALYRCAEGAENHKCSR